LQGIKEVKLNSLTKIVQVNFNLEQIKLSQILAAINHLGYKPQLKSELYDNNIAITERKNSLKRLVVAGFGMMFIMTLSVPLYSHENGGIDNQMYRFFALLSMLIATAIYFYAGKTFLQNAYRDLSNKHLGMDVPIALSLTLAYAVSSFNVLSHNGHTIYFDSMVMFVFFLLAERVLPPIIPNSRCSADAKEKSANAPTFSVFTLSIDIPTV